MGTRYDSNDSLGAHTFGSPTVVLTAQSQGEKGDEDAGKYGFLAKLTISKIYLIAAMLVYAVSAYAKSEKGIKLEDLVSMILFLIFLVISFFFMHLSAFLYRELVLTKDIASIQGKILCLIKRFWLAIIFCIVFSFIAFLYLKNIIEIKSCIYDFLTTIYVSKK